MAGRNGYRPDWGKRAPASMAWANGAHPLCPTTAFIWDGNRHTFRFAGGGPVPGWSWFDRVRGTEASMSATTHTPTGGKGALALTVGNGGIYLPQPSLSSNIGTFVCRINQSSSSGYASLYTDDSTPRGIYITNPGQQLTWFEGADNLGTQALSFNTWYDLAIVTNGTAKAFYVNGVLDKSFTLAASWPTSSVLSPSFFGGTGGGRNFLGAAEFCFTYASPLNAAQVAELYARPYSWLQVPSPVRVFAPASGPNARVTQETLETALQGAPSTRVTQADASVLMPSIYPRVTQETAETALKGAPSTRITQADLSLLMPSAIANLQVTQETEEVALKGTSSVRVTQADLMAALQSGPNLRVTQADLSVLVPSPYTVDVPMAPYTFATVGLEGTAGVPVRGQVELDYTGTSIQSVSAPKRASGVQWGRGTNRVLLSSYGAAGDLSIEVTPDKATKLFYASLARLATTGAGPYTHVFRNSQFLRPLSVHVHRGGPGWWVYPGMLVSRMTLSGKLDAMLEATFSLSARASEMVFNAEQSDGGIAASTEDPFAFHQGSITFDGGSTSYTNNWQIVLDHAVSIKGEAARGRQPGKLVAGKSLVSGSFDAVFADITEYRKFLGAIGDTFPAQLGAKPQLGAARLLWTQSGTRSLQVDMAQFYYRAVDLPVGDRTSGIILQKCQFESRWDAATDTDFSLTIVNGETDAAITTLGTGL